MAEPTPRGKRVHPPLPPALFVSGGLVEVRDAAGEFHRLTEAEACRRLLAFDALAAALERLAREAEALWQDTGDGGYWEALGHARAALAALKGA